MEAFLTWLFRAVCCWQDFFSLSLVEKDKPFIQKVSVCRVRGNMWRRVPEVVLSKVAQNLLKPKYINQWIKNKCTRQNFTHFWAFWGMHCITKFIVWSVLSKQCLFHHLPRAWSTRALDNVNLKWVKPACSESRVQRQDRMDQCQLISQTHNAQISCKTHHDLRSHKINLCSRAHVDWINGWLKLRYKLNLYYYTDMALNLYLFRWLWPSLKLQPLKLVSAVKVVLLFQCAAWFSRF